MNKEMQVRREGPFGRFFDLFEPEFGRFFEGFPRLSRGMTAGCGSKRRCKTAPS